jgi:hypothetical protein
MKLRVVERATVALIAMAAGTTMIAACGSSEAAKTTASTSTALSAGRNTSPSTTAHAVDQRTESSNKSFTVILPKNWGATRPDPADKFQRMRLITNGDQWTDIVVNAGFDPAERHSNAKVAAENDIFCKQNGGVESATVDGEPAWRCTYTAQDVRGTNLYVQHGGDEYQVIYSGRLDGFEKLGKDYEAVMNSWKWSN